MTVTIYHSTKFNHSEVQYFAEAAGYTLLRLTCGNRRGKPGGAIKTATSSDFGAPSAYRDREALIAAMCDSVPRLGGQAQDVSIEMDGKGRKFGEITLSGSQDELIEALQILGEEMESCLLHRDSAQDAGYSDLRDLYNDLCHTDGEPVYLSDGVYLGPDGRAFE